MDYECVECWYPIVWDDDLEAWLHEDRPDGQSFDHHAQVELPALIDGLGGAK